VAVPGVAPQELLAAEFNFSAPSSFVLAATSWLLGILIWGWVLTQPPGAFHDQGSMTITLGVIPLTLVLWIVGGPVALALGQRGFDRVRPDKDRDHRLALAGIALSRLMLWGGFVVLCLVLSQVNW
jgi:nitric oxide reductase large subunit